MAFSWTKERRDQAKSEGKCLFVLAVDGRPDPKAKLGKIEYEGVCTEDEADILLRAANQVMAMQKKRRGA